MITVETLANEFANFLVNQTISQRINDWIYWVMQDIYAMGPFWWMKDVKSFTSVADQKEYILNHRLANRGIIGIFDQTNNRELDRREIEDFYRSDPTPTETGIPHAYAFRDIVEVETINSAAGAVSVTSSSTADNGISLIVRGEVSDIERTDVVVLNGTGTVAGALTFDAESVTLINLQTPCAGYVTVSLGSDILVQIPPGVLRVRCPRIRFFRTPDDAFTYDYVFYKKAVRPSNTYEIIDMPDEAMKALRYGIEEIGHFNNGDVDFSTNAYQKYNEAKEELFRWSMRNENQVDQKSYVPSERWEFRLPDVINGTVTT